MIEGVETTAHTAQVAAEEATSTAVGVGSGAVGLMAIGAVVWLMKRTFGHTIPRISADFKESLKEQRAEFTSALREQRADLLAVLERADERSADERRQCHESIEQIRRELAALRDALRGS